MPFVGCNNGGGGDKPKEVKFSLSSDHPIEVVDKTATVYVDWTPTDTIKFSPFTFTANPEKKSVTSFTQTGDPRPMPVKITFIEDITEDISGTLSFKYEDVTAKTKGTVVLEFENKKVVGYDFDVESERYYDTTGTLAYNEITPDYPIEPGL